MWICVGRVREPLQHKHRALASRIEVQLKHRALASRIEMQLKQSTVEFAHYKVKELMGTVTDHSVERRVHAKRCEVNGWPYPKFLEVRRSPPLVDRCRGPSRACVRASVGGCWCAVVFVPPLPLRAAGHEPPAADDPCHPAEGADVRGTAVAGLSRR